MDDAWSYDATVSYSLVNLSSSNLNYFSSAKTTNALNVTGTAANAACISGPPCVPYNLFQPGGVTPAALAYLSVPGIELVVTSCASAAPHASSASSNCIPSFATVGIPRIIIFSPVKSRIRPSF